jgi:heptosyltransferase-2
MAQNPVIMRLRDFRHIVILQTAFIGDVALVLYLAETVRRLNPEARITLVTTPVAATFAQYCTALTSVVAFDKRGKHKGFGGIVRLAGELRKSGVDCVLAPHRSFRTAVLARLLRAQCSVGFTKNSLAWLYNKRVEYAPVHEIERNAALLSVFEDCATLPQAKPTISLPASIDEASRALLQKYGLEKGFIACAPGSVWATKRWREEHFIRLAELLRREGKRVVLLGGKEDEALCRRIAEKSGCASLAGKTSLPEMLALLRSASVLVGNDSAPAHLAALVDCPTVAVFGPTVQAFGFAPRSSRSAVLENTGLACRPCSPHGTNTCPLGTHECMWSVQPEKVLEAARNLMLNPSTGSEAKSA